MGSRSTSPKWPDLEPAVPGDGMCRSHLDRLVDIRALQDVESADDFLGLGERPVTDDDFAVAHPNGLGRTRRLEPVAIQPDTASDHVIEPGKAPALTSLARFRPVIGIHGLISLELGLVDAYQHHELHLSSPILLAFTPSRRTTVPQKDTPRAGLPEPRPHPSLPVKVATYAKETIGCHNHRKRTPAPARARDAAGAPGA